MEYSTIMQNYLSINIPEELQEFSKVAEVFKSTEPDKDNFGVQTIKDNDGNLIGTEYYSANGELLKKVYYKGSSVTTVEHYRNTILYSQEKYDTGKIIQKTLYNHEGSEVNVIKYKYNRENQIVYIQKQINNTVYSVEYGYDELKRANSRIIRAGSKTICNQQYRYDILDRIVEYKDDNQLITVHKVNPNNELISYTIRDIVGNIIVNKFKYKYCVVVSFVVFHFFKMNNKIHQIKIYFIKVNYLLLYLNDVK